MPSPESAKTSRRRRPKAEALSAAGEDEAARLSRAVAEHLRFSPDAGHIQLFGQRMLLMHAQSFAELRRELITRLGLAGTRELLTRLGYRQGFDDGQRVRALNPEDLAHALALGPRLRETEGFVRTLPIDAMRFDPAKGEFWGDFLWTAPWEAEAHLQQIGLSGEPACWVMRGYADGYCTAVTGVPIYWREVECVAMGHAHCRVIGKPLAAWDDLSESEIGFLQADSFVTAPVKSRAPGFNPLAEAVAGRAATATNFEGFVGASPGFNAVANLVRRVAPTDSTVLFRGESGVGKECFARAMHSISPRANKPMVSINCAAIPPELVEAELFGVERGAYTGADHARAGRFERADGGTLFLDEISSLPLPAQGKVLRAIQEREIERVGGTQVRKIDVRIVSAANCDLRVEMEAGRFRTDLFYRLNVFPIEIPPLRERREDVPLLVSLFLDRYTQRFAKAVQGLTPRAWDALWDYDWPGNVRELENMVQRAVILAESGGTIDVQHLFAGGEKLRPASFNLGAQGALVPTGGASILDATDPRRRLAADLLKVVPSLKEIETLLVDCAMEQADGNLSAAARLLRLQRGQVEYRVKRQQGGTMLD
ncbi:sigma-54-dependent Fis family transcriptional regulator [Nevskia ramosa]|uniref:sigma-54-dependent Fis family transcriptional regulator n=1 Tax=Nevskia ramosa TaxID=64002 RepID=UPI0003B61534|nr:sigma-54-dependent Fis family transcriptional regulator [Nevskia ramosa]